MAIVERGPWRARITAEVNHRTFIESDDFTHDVRLYVDGDFGSQEERLEYAEEIANRLNAYKSPNAQVHGRPAVPCNVTLEPNN